MKSARFFFALASLLLSVWCRPALADETFRLMSYNIHHGEGTDGKLDLKRIAEFIKAQNADAVVLQEVDKKCERTGKVDQPEELAKLTGMTASFAKGMDFQGGEYGICTLTKEKPESFRRVELPRASEPRASAVTVLPLADGKVTLANLHIDHLSEDARLAQIKALTAALKDAPGPVLLAGDFNSVPGKAVLNFLKSEGWTIPAKQGAPETFPSSGPRIEIDHVVFRNMDGWEIAEYRVLDQEVFSDHRAIVAEFKKKK